MFKRISLIILSVSLLAGSLALTGCAAASSGNELSSLNGYWKSGYGDGFEISGTSYAQYDDTEKHVSFAGTIVNAPDLTADSGFLTVKITNSGTWLKTANYYYVIQWKNLSLGKVSASAANNGDYLDVKNNGMASQALAEAEYTISNGYFGYFGDYLKQ